MRQSRKLCQEKEFVGWRRRKKRVDDDSRSRVVVQQELSHKWKNKSCKMHLSFKFTCWWQIEKHKRLSTFIPAFSSWIRDRNSLSQECSESMSSFNASADNIIDISSKFCVRNDDDDDLWLSSCEEHNNDIWLLTVVLMSQVSLREKRRLPLVFLVDVYSSTLTPFVLIIRLLSKMSWAACSHRVQDRVQETMRLVSKHNFRRCNQKVA